MMLPFWLRRWFQWCEWRYLYRRFIGFFQRGWRGWADHDVWGFDHYIAGVLVGGLRRLAETKHGVPMSFLPDLPEGQWEHTGEQVEQSFRDWKAWLYNKADWFEWYYLDEDGTSDDKGWIKPGLSRDEMRRRMDAYHAKMEKFFNEVLPDFVRHYGGLWD